MRGTGCPCIGLRRLYAVWLGELRMTRPPAIGQQGDVGLKRQLDLLPTAPQPPSGLVPLDRRARGTEFLSVPVRSVLNSPAATHMPFWSLNPYVGCEFGCTYCYARDTHRYMVERMGGKVETLPAWEAFERRIIVKPGAAEVLIRTLEPRKLAGSSLVIGTATDPYQPAERKYRLTRRVLEALLAYRGLRIGLISKSPLVTRDIDVLQSLSERHEVSVNVSLATLDPRLARRLELRSPVPAARLRALAKLTRAGIRAGLLIAPIVPCVTDGRAALDSLFRAAREAGAHYVVGAALRLGPAARHRFLPHLAREFPDLAERYARHYAGRTSVARDYQDALSRRLRALRRKYGLNDDRFGSLADPDHSPDAQGQLFGSQS
jgi:DNA repair photolyase